MVNTQKEMFLVVYVRIPAEGNIDDVVVKTLGPFSEWRARQARQELAESHQQDGGALISKIVKVNFD